jgi:hypothetical protein
MLNHIKNIPQNNIYLKTESFTQDPLILMHFKADILLLNLSIQIIICYLFLFINILSIFIIVSCNKCGVTFGVILLYFIVLSKYPLFL